MSSESGIKTTIAVNLDLRVEKFKAKAKILYIYPHSA